MPNCEHVDPLHICPRELPFCEGYIKDDRWGTCKANFTNNGDKCDVHFGNKEKDHVQVINHFVIEKLMIVKRGHVMNIFEHPNIQKISPKFPLLNSWTRKGAHFHSLDSMKCRTNPSDRPLNNQPVMMCENRGGKKLDNNTHVDAITGMQYIEERNNPNDKTDKTHGYWKPTCNPT